MRVLAATGNGGAGVARLAGGAVLFLAYLATARLGLSVAFVDGTVSPVWPSSGLAIAALALWRPRLWPVITVAVIAADFLFVGNPTPVAVGIAVGNTLEAVLGALVLCRLGVVGEVTRIRDALAILGVALLAPLPAAIGGVLSLTLAGLSAWDHYGWVCLVWWLGDTMGALMVLPLILAWAGQRSLAAPPARPIEFAGALAATVAAISFVYLRGDALAALGMEHLPPSAFLFGPMVWAVLRLRPRETTLVIAAATVLAVAYTVAFTTGETVGPLLSVQMMMFCLGGSSLLLVGALTERHRAIADLEQSKLTAEKAKVAAELASRGKSEFVAAVRHDLRQPLQALQLFVATLVSRVKGETETMALQRMARSIDAMVATLASLNDLTLIECGQVPIQPDRFKLGDLLAQIAEEYRLQAAQKGLRLRFVPCTRAVETDFQLLGRILRNLLSNAVRYTERGSVLLGCRRVSGGGMRIEVWDNGPGIPAEEQEAIFLAFHRSARPPRAIESGVGLGLATVDRLASLLGLQVTLRSTVGKGSVFSVVVPGGAHLTHGRVDGGPYGGRYAAMGTGSGRKSR